MLVVLESFWLDGWVHVAATSDTPVTITAAPDMPVGGSSGLAQYFNFTPEQSQRLIDDDEAVALVLLLAS